MENEIDVDELQAIAELKGMSREELEKVEHAVLKWVCQVKGCNRHTKVWDFGIENEFYSPLKNWGWHTTNFYFMCGKHYKWIKKLNSLYGEETVLNKVFDWTKFRLQPL